MITDVVENFESYQFGLVIARGYTSLDESSELSYFLFELKRDVKEHVQADILEVPVFHSQEIGQNLDAYFFEGLRGINGHNASRTLVQNRVTGLTLVLAQIVID